MENNWKVWLIASAILTATTGVNTTSAFAASIPNTGTSFTDLNGISLEQTEAIREAARLGLIAGFPNNEYRPEQALTRQEFAVLLVKALDLPLEGDSVSSFKDVKATSWSLPYIEAARQAGLMNGSGSAFRPQAFVSREEMASVLLRAVNGQNASGGLNVNQNSIGPVSGWARNSVEAAARLGLIESSFMNLNLKGSVTRANIAPFLVNIFPEKEATATVTSVSGDTIMVDNKPLLVTDSLKQLLLGNENLQALEGAKLTFKMSRHSVGGISEIEIMDSGTTDNRLKFNANGFPSSGVLKLSGNYITVDGSSISNVTLQNSASNVELNANINKLQIDNSGELNLSGKVSFGELRISNANAKLTIGPNVQIDRIVLPTNANPALILNNLSQITGQIKQAFTSSGTVISLSRDTATTQPVFTAPANSDPVTVTPPADPNLTSVEQDRANLTIGFKEGDNGNSVTHSVRLPTTGIQGSAISWISDNEASLSSNGTVTRAVYGSGDSNVKLTATLTKGAVTRTQDFTLTVKAEEFPVTNKAILSSKINDAQLLFDLTSVGNDEGQAPEQAVDAFSLAIQAARQVSDNKFAQQNEVDAATGTLDTAITDFEQAVVGVSKQLLLQKISEAFSLHANTPVGLANGNVSDGARESLFLSMSAAQEIAQNPEATKQEVMESRLYLSQAIDAFNASKIVVDKMILSGKINEAGRLLIDLKVGVRKGQVPSPPHEELGAILEAVQFTYDDDTVSQQEVNDDVTRLVGRIQALQDSIIPTDISQLFFKIREAELFLEHTVIGTDPGNATIDAANALTQAKNIAKEVHDDTTATSAQIDSAVESITAALNVFHQAKIPELTIALAPNAEFIMNNKSTDKVHISDLNGKNNVTTYQYTKRNILDLVRVKKGDQEQFLKYDATSGNFKVYDDASLTKDTGRRLTVTSASPELSIAPAPYGAAISQHALSDNTTAEVEINLTYQGLELSDVKLPVTIDNVAPIWSTPVYDAQAGTITLTSNERVLLPNGNYNQSGATKSASIQIQYSPNGTFTDTATTAGSRIVNGNELILLLPEQWKGPRPSGSKIRVTLSGITDYGYNEPAIQTFLIDAGPPASNNPIP